LSERIASCPNCGAEIAFRWSGAIQTTCPACRSILVRHDVNLEKVGKVADVPASMSGIQLGTEGRFKDKAFVVVGRIIYRYEHGHWSEWHLRFADGGSGWLSDAQAEFAVSRASNKKVKAKAEDLGEVVKIDGKPFTVTAITDASYAGVEGELPFEYWDKREIRFIDLRGEGDSFATIDESETPRLLFVGEFEEFEELRFKNLRDGADRPAATTPRSKGLNCPSCGAAITLRTGDLALNVACPACGSIVDVRDPNYAILQGHQEKMRGIKPEIPLGTVGKLKGKSWQVIGYQIRGITVEGILYQWREYLLWSADGGFRYLTEYEGHWNDVAPMKGFPRQVKGGSQPVVEYLGTQFKHFQGADVVTSFVLGEFPWQVRVGDRVFNDDFVAPPVMLSRERTENEITWSLGTYTPPERIREAFKLQKELRKPTGVFANQPNPRGSNAGELARMFLAFLGVLLLLLITRQVTARREQVFTDGYKWNRQTGDTGAFVTRLFDLKGRASNVQVRIDTDLSNDWAYFNVALLPENGGRGFELGREISRYSGVEGGESWSEGSSSDRATLPSVPPGRYYLRIEPEHESSYKPFTYAVSLRRDVPRVWPFLVALGLLAVPPLIAWASHATFESARWAESDYAPESSDDDE
jgi:predicted RNA-binding Zn-ribbon protein involved in translation (DUF1610 family)